MQGNCPDPSFPPNDIDADEPLARSVFSIRHFKKGKREGEPDKVLPRAFEPGKNKEKAGERYRDISVDRLVYLTRDRSLELGEDRARRRAADTHFHGWAILLARDASGTNRDVISSPLDPDDEDNPAHADIWLPQDTVANDEARDAHLFELAKNSCWLDVP